MLRIRRFLKPYLLMLAVTIILLFVQANLDLALPDYLAQIVNTGIQQGGVDQPRTRCHAPGRRWSALCSSWTKTTKLPCARPTRWSSRLTAANDYVETYPLLTAKRIYVLGALTAEELDGSARPWPRPSRRRRPRAGHG
jgi:ATP-binding cassette, subfamily B, multidrug efflux pump